MFRHAADFRVAVVDQNAHPLSEQLALVHDERRNKLVLRPRLGLLRGQTNSTRQSGGTVQLSGSASAWQDSTKSLRWFLAFVILPGRQRADHSAERGKGISARIRFEAGFWVPRK